MELMVKNRVISLIALAFTLCIIHIVPSSLAILIILLAFWILIFQPWSRADTVMFVLASVFFLGQNYAVLRTGGFTFRFKDILLMPYYEPFMWGFYFLHMKRFVSEPQDALPVTLQGFFGLLLTAVAFSVFGKDASRLFLATLASTAILLIMFHDFYDLYYAAYALALGFVIELFGVSSGLWSYPAPDFLGIPYWFATMWLSVGILGRRFLIPAAQWISIKLPKRFSPH